MSQKKDAYPAQQYDVTEMPFEYIAGLIDSDGALAIGRWRTPRGNYYYYPLVHFSQYNPSICRGFAKRFGGYHSESKKRVKNENSWQIRCKVAVKFAKEIEPF